MEFKRHVYRDLIKWREKPTRKPLIVRGARQVGKTTLVSHFAQEYKYSIVLNLERKRDKQFFLDFDEASVVTEALFTANNIPSSEKASTLLFIDEVQESPEALAMLRYFYEDVPELHVVAAGSLLEHVMGKVKSFPVGRVEYLYVQPLNFSEFLAAKGMSAALEQLGDFPTKETAHPTLLNLFHEYAIIGGMPEVVATFLKGSLSDLAPVYESIWSTYKNDIEKYASSKAESRVIKHVISSAHLYLDQRIKFQGFGNSNYKSREIGEALRNLDDARIIQLIYPTAEIKPPVIPDLKKSPRLQFLDTGLVNYELGIQTGMLAMNDLSEAYKGSVIPHLITQELISLSKHSYKKPNFWVRQKNQSSAEVDLVYTFKGKLIPIEVKSGKEGKLKSLHQFIDKSEHTLAVRMYAGKFSIETHKTPMGQKEYTLLNLPYYLGTQLAHVLAWFYEVHKA